MTRKDYIVLAEAFRKTIKKYEGRIKEEDAVFDAVYEICDALKRDNPRFDRGHFLDVINGEKELDSRPKRVSRPGLPVLSMDGSDR